MPDINYEELFRQQQAGRDDDNEDLSKLDRGDNLDKEGDADKGDADKGDDQGDDQGDDTDKQRDEKGRFAKKDKKPEQKEGEDKEGGEEEEEEEEEEEQEEGEKNLGVRFNKMKQQRDRERQQREAAQREANELRAQLAAAKGDKKEEPKADPIEAINAELDDLYEQVEEARADGKVKEAAKLQRQIDAKREEIVTLKAERISSKATTVAAENARYDAMLDQIESSLPILQPDHEDFDQSAVRALEFHVEAYEKMGLTPSKALAQAAKFLFGYGVPQPKAKEVEKKEAPKVEPKKTDIKKAVDNAMKQPPDSSGAGVNRGEDTKLDPRTLTEEQFDALPESKKAALRGDFIKA